MEMFRPLLSIVLFCLAFSPILLAQNGGSFSGGFEGNANFFLKDDKIGANNTDQYDHQLVGVESWLDLSYSNWGFNFGVRFDMFNNSNLLNPTDSYSASGIGKWYISKTIGDLSITGGYVYDQIGSGIIFRAYEERPLLIDNALLGARLKYSLGENWTIMGFAGKQKYLFDTYDAFVKGGSIDGFLSFGNEEEGKTWSIAPGIGLVNRTLSNAQMESIIGTLTTYQEVDRVKPTYNNYMFSLYNTLSAGPITWYVEGAYKPEDVFYDPTAIRTTLVGGKAFGKLVNEPGTVIYSSLSYARNSLGITLEGKRTENFDVRVDPQLSQNNGFLGFIPPMNRLNTYRLTARYNPATQFIGEFAGQLDIRYAINKKLSAAVNFSNIMDLDASDVLYREIYTEVMYKKPRKYQITGGVQLQRYNQALYEGKTGVPLVQTITPYGELLYKFSRKKSLRVEAQYMHTEQDFGSWIFGLAEFGIAPKWLFEASAMYNIVPHEKDGVTPDAILYPTLGVVFNHKSNRFGLRYVKQVEGVVCSGGICRLEPAFSGVKFQINSNF